jgi:predicted glutamine amidotransferase
MCGIAAIINYSGAKLKPEFISYIFSNLESRGRDAAGYYFERLDEDGHIIRRNIKAPVPASKLYSMVHGNSNKDLQPYQFSGTERLILLHARQRTKGTEQDNNNNHPIISENYVLVHNGSVDDASIVPKYLYNGAVDSEHIIANLETSGLRGLASGVFGTMSIMFKKLSGNSLFFIRNSNPLDIISYPKKIVVLISLASLITDTNIENLNHEMFRQSTKIKSIPIDTLYAINLNKPKIRLVKSIKIATYKPYNTTTRWTAYDHRRNRLTPINASATPLTDAERIYNEEY